MGFKFTLDLANTVANLTFGKVESCYQDIRNSPESYDRFMVFLKLFHEDLYSDRVEQYKERANLVREILSRHEYNKQSFEKIEKDLLEALGELSKIFKQCRIKSLLLPKMRIFDDGYNGDEFMILPNTLKQLFNLHKGDSCLILQPKERPKVATVLNAFPHFDVALRQADLWPAVMFWDNKENYVFVPIEHKKELCDLYKIVRDEQEPIKEIKRITEKKKKPSHYIFQLSDLHFGAKNVKTAARRLKFLIKSQFDSIEAKDNVSFVITGDSVDSPNNSNENDYRDFSEYLKENYSKNLISVLGNHDINSNGLAFFHGKQQIANKVGEYPKIEVLKNSKVILLLFNSNTDGMLAEGKIGKEQMAEMGNQLDKVKKLGDYLLIAVMHHHLLPIPQPEYYDGKWFEKFLSYFNLLEGTLKLKDAELFSEWLKERNVRFVLHGHKHIPFVAKCDGNGINAISCGSSTGQIAHKNRDKTHISYNLIKISEKAVTCSQFAEEILGTGAKHIRTEIMPR